MEAFRLQKGDYFIMPKVVYTSTKGLVQEGGSGITFESTPSSAVQAITAAGAVTLPGIYTISGSSILTVTMPLASAYPGGVYSFRNASVHAHLLTGSTEALGTRVFAGPSTGAAANSNGSKLTFSNVVGCGATMISDGANFCIMANSGTLTYAT